MHASLPSRVVIANVVDAAVALAEEIMNTYTDEHPFTREFGHPPGLIIEPLFANAYFSQRFDYDDLDWSPPGTEVRRVEEWAPDFSGFCYWKQPGPKLGSYCVTGPGFGGGAYSGAVMREAQHTWQHAQNAQAKKTLPRKSVLGWSGEIYQNQIELSFPSDLNQTLWENLHQMAQTIDGTLYIEWASFEHDGERAIGLTQVAMTPVIETTRDLTRQPLVTFEYSNATHEVTVIGGVGEMLDVRKLAAVPSHDALRQYLDRFTSAQTENAFSGLQEPHLLVITPKVVNELKDLIARRVIEPQHIFAGLVGSFEIQPSDYGWQHESLLADHFGAGFAESGRFIVSTRLSETQLAKLNLSGADLQALQKLAGPEQDLTQNTSGSLITVDWQVAPNQPLGVVDIYLAQ